MLRKKRHAQTLSFLLANGPILTPLPSKETEKEGSLICGRALFVDCLFRACKKGYVDVVKVLLDHHPDKYAAVNVVAEFHKNAITAMHHACRGGSVGMFRFLLASGAKSWKARPKLQGLADPPLFLTIKHGHFGTLFL